MECATTDDDGIGDAPQQIAEADFELEKVGRQKPRKGKKGQKLRQRLRNATQSHDRAAWLLVPKVASHAAVALVAIALVWWQS